MRTPLVKPDAATLNTEQKTKLLQKRLKRLKNSFGFGIISLSEGKQQIKNKK